MGGRGVRLRRTDAARVVGIADAAASARHGDRADVGADARGDGYGRDDDGPPLRRPLHPRAGVSGPQVVEGWYGQPFAKPLTRTREYIDVLRAVLRREEPVSYQGEFVRMPYDGPNSWGMGKPLRVMVHPLRADLPIYLGAEGPKNVALAAEIADGWLPLYYSPFRPEVYGSLQPAQPDFEICVTVMGCAITDNLEAGLLPTKAALAFYIGGMGA